MSPTQTLVLATTFAIGAICYLLSDVLTPFAISILLAYLAYPLVDVLVRLKAPRLAATILVMLGLFALSLSFVFILIPIVSHQLAYLVDFLPRVSAWLENSVFPWIGTHIGVDARNINISSVVHTLLENWRDLGNMAQLILPKINRFGQGALTWIGFLLIIPVVTFYLLRDWHRLLEKVRQLLPRQLESRCAEIVGECDKVLGEFFHGQIFVMLILALIYSSGLWLIGVETAFLVGIFAGMISFVPYLGTLLGVLLASLSVLVQTGDLIQVSLVVVLFAVGSVIEGAVLSPWIIGNRVGLHPVTVIFALLAGGQLFGLFGVLISVPVASILAVLLRHLREHYRSLGVYR